MPAWSTIDGWLSEWLAQLGCHAILLDIGPGEDDESVKFWIMDKVELTGVEAVVSKVLHNVVTSVVATYLDGVRNGL